MQCMRYLSIHRYACMVTPEVWRLIPYDNLLGIRCEGNVFIPFWDCIRNVCLKAGSSISHLCVKLNTMTVSSANFADYADAMRRLSSTVLYISLDMSTCTADYNCRHAFLLIQRSFRKLRSIHLLRLDHYSQKWALHGSCWSCSSDLRVLVLCQCVVSLSSLSEFLSIMLEVDELILDTCSSVEFQDDVGYGVLELPFGRSFKQICVAPFAVAQPKHSVEYSNS
jgi:hypothetical protein